MRPGLKWLFLPAAGSVAASLCGTEAAADDNAWQTVFTGYFRAPLAIAIAHRPDPGSNNGAAGTQLSFAPNVAVDGPFTYPTFGNFTGFAFTRLQEIDWAEVFIHEQKKHLDTAVGWGGYWYQAAGFQKPYAAWMPAWAWIRLDWDFGNFSGSKANVAVQLGSFWPSFGYFPVYDTYTMGRFHQIGERLDLTIPVEDWKLTLTHGFGVSRKGFVSVGTVPVVGLTNQTTTALDLLTYANLAIDYKNIHLGLHWNRTWTNDPGNDAGLPIGISDFQNVRDASLQVLAAEAKWSHPRAGTVWVSPTYVTVKNGWALDQTGGGVEVLHSQGGGFSANYMGYTGTVSNSTGSGSTVAVGALYENTLGDIRGEGFGAVLPDWKLSAFALLAASTRDLLPNANLSRTLDQLKWGASLTLQALDWLGVMLRFDQVLDANPQFHDLGLRQNYFSVITPRLIFQTQFLSNEVLYLQYSRYLLGDAYDSTTSQGQFPPTGPVHDIVKAEATMAW